MNANAFGFPNKWEMDAWVIQFTASSPTVAGITLNTAGQVQSINWDYVNALYEYTDNSITNSINGSKLTVLPSSAVL